MNPKQLWHAALGDLQLQVSPANFETWFRNTKAVAQDGDTIVIGAPTTFAKEWLEQRFHREIETTLSRLIGQNVTARIVVQQRGQSASARSLAPVATGFAVGLADPPEDRELISPTPTGLPGRSKPLGVPDQPHLNPRYTFGDFIVGQSNRLAHAASLAVADNPARAYNPLFIYGGVGLGKTHLLHAIGHTAIGRGLRVTYVSSEKFTNDLINSIRERRTEEFRAHYRTSDILLIDDIQFIAGKEGTQEEFFHTFNALHESNRQIVLSSDRPPKAITTLEDRLRSRFEWGLIADVQPPDYETRMAILRAKGEGQAVRVPAEVVEFLARKVQSNIRELEGSLNRLVALALLNNQKITIEFAASALTELAEDPRRRTLTTLKVVQAVADHFRVDIRDLRGKQRDKAIVLPRQVAMYLMREETDASLVEIGRELGGRDHSTVLHGCEKIGSEINANNTLRRDVLSIREAIYAEGP